MKAKISCESCRREYDIDLAQYGGKKVKCKQCGVAIAVPVGVSPEPATSTGNGDGKASLLLRDRLASKRGAVNIALLQRRESSREEIRQAWFAMYGTAESRLAWAEPLGRVRDDASQSLKEHQDRIELLKSILARAAAVEPSSGAFAGAQDQILPANPGALLGGSELPEATMAFNIAVQVLGAPVPPKPPPPPQKKSFMQSFEDWFDSKKDHDKANRAREAKLETLRLALSKMEAMKQPLAASLASAEARLASEMQARNSDWLGKIAAVRQALAEGRLNDAASAVTSLQRQVPPDVAGAVQAVASEVAYRNGSPMDAARSMQDAICFGVSAPAGMEKEFNDLWAKAAAGLPAT